MKLRPPLSQEGKTENENCGAFLSLGRGCDRLGSQSGPIEGPPANDGNQPVPIFRVTVVPRTTKPSITIDLKALQTDLGYSALDPLPYPIGYGNANPRASPRKAA